MTTIFSHTRPRGLMALSGQTINGKSFEGLERTLPRWLIINTLEHLASPTGIAADRRYAAAAAECLNGYHHWLALPATRTQALMILRLLYGPRKGKVATELSETVKGVTVRNVAAFLCQLDRVLPRMRFGATFDHQPHPNDNMVDYALRIGMEPSLVLYVQKGRYTPRSFTTDELRWLEGSAQLLGADEHTEVQPGVFRLWWD